MGYMGHLTLIAEEVVKFTERHPPELLSETVLDKVMSQDWINYVEGALAETRERDNAILGGVRPEIAVNNRPPGGGGLAAVGLSGLGSSLGLSSQGGASSALAEAGLNGGLDLHGNGDGNPGPFSISAGISSGFHSSSDEDEDDTDENDEDVNNEVSAHVFACRDCHWIPDYVVGQLDSPLLPARAPPVMVTRDDHPRYTWRILGDDELSEIMEARAGHSSEPENDALGTPGDASPSSDPSIHDSLSCNKDGQHNQPLFE